MAIHQLLWLCCNFLGIPVYAQVFPDTTTNLPIDVDFLFHYYDQDGNHSAVTGGQGTEKLEDISNNLIVNIPLDSTQTLDIGVSLNVYSSASTDRIDRRMSSASLTDVRGAFQVGWGQENPRQSTNWHWQAGASIESDYISTHLGGSFYKSFKDDHTSLWVEGKAYFDKWVLYFPEELRTTVQPTITTDKRNSYHLDIQLQQVINRRLNMALSTGLEYQSGLLSTPFHRVYFPEEGFPRIEYFPAQRWKWPLGIRVNYFLGGRTVLRFFYRYYWDDFGIHSHTISLESPIKLNYKWAVTPVYRYYQQSASDYFAPFDSHSPDAPFYTSDYDLSAFRSHKWGLGIRYAPYSRFTLLRQKWKAELKLVSLRWVSYTRSDGLRAWSLGGHLGWRF
ncbi:MAG TPA: DUF3570 domain-containing protein [Saprospiraceae bacterium]|nr:DUF3570 domain-containing protein [Saprospiraceae bacterium]HMQ82447.1 DUF3570 domain-containing protein [Saprospiraceae bacterium]